MIVRRPRPHPARRRPASEANDAEESGLRIVFHLLAIALIGAWMTPACLAEEAARDGGSSTLSVNPDGARPPAGEDAAAGGAKLDNQLAPDAPGDSKNTAGEGARKGNAVAKDINASGPGGTDLDGIDTRISVQPRRLGRRDEVRQGNTKLTPPASRILHPRRLSAHDASSRVTRDAIGVPVVRHDGTEQGDGQRHDLPALVHNPAAATTGFSAGASGGLARTGRAFGRPTSNINSVVRPAVLNRGAINGTTLTRPGIGPSGVGGPAKSVAGISGTTVRPKH